MQPGAGDGAPAKSPALKLPACSLGLNTRAWSPQRRSGTLGQGPGGANRQRHGRAPVSGAGQLPAVSTPAAWPRAPHLGHAIVLWGTVGLPELEGSEALSSVPAKFPGGSESQDGLSGADSRGAAILGVAEGSAAAPPRSPGPALLGDGVRGCVDWSRAPSRGQRGPGRFRGLTGGSWPSGARCQGRRGGPGRRAEGRALSSYQGNQGPFLGGRVVPRGRAVGHRARCRRPLGLRSRGARGGGGAGSGAVFTGQRADSRLESGRRARVPGGTLGAGAGPYGDRRRLWDPLRLGSLPGFRPHSMDTDPWRKAGLARGSGTAEHTVQNGRVLHARPGPSGPHKVPEPVR